VAEQNRWHPLLAAWEDPTGTWSLLDAFDRVYGTIELRRVSATDLRYRVSFRGELIGWSTTLRIACERLHPEFFRDQGSRARATRPRHDRSKEAKYRGSRGAGSAREFLQAGDPRCGRARCNAPR
jgi:hypothetical protein